MKKSLSIIMMFLIFITACQSGSSNKQGQLLKPSGDDAFELQLYRLTEQIISSMDNTERITIAVIDFSSLEGKVTTIGKYLAEELTTRLFLTRRFEVVERRLIDKLVQEQKLNLSGLISESDAKSVGEFLGVDVIATGTLTDLGESIKVNARIINTETGLLMSVASVTLQKDSSLATMMGQELPKTTQSSTQTRSIKSGKSMKFTSGKGSTTKQKSTDKNYDTSKIQLSLNKKTYKQNESITVNYQNMPNYKYNWITIVPANTSSGTYYDYLYTLGKSSGSMTFTGMETSGLYEARLYMDYPDGGYEIRKSVSFKVGEGATSIKQATLIINQASYSIGDSIDLKYSGMSGSSGDWIAISKVDQNEDEYGDYFYTYGKTSGNYTFNAPTSPGKYEIRAYFDWPHGGYKIQNRVEFNVK